jgi:uncharacterized protein YukE
MTEQEVKEKFDELYTKYQQTMEMLVDALDNITLLEKQLDKKPKEVIIEKEVVIEPRPEIVKALALLQKKYDKTLKALEDKPKEVIVEKEIEIIKEIEVEVEKVVEKIVEVEIPKETVVTVEKEVPGPERIVEVPGPERRVEVPGPERVVVRTDTKQIEKLNKQITALQSVIKNIEDTPAEVKEVEKESTGDLKDAAKLMATSELNKEDLTEQEIYNILLKNSEDGVKEKICFWAMPLPNPDDNKPINKKYLGKK